MTAASAARHRFLEFDHGVPVANGGEATVENIRLRCRAHNQLEAERAFGAGFMASKREAARLAAAEARAMAAEERVRRGYLPAFAARTSASVAR